MVAKKRPSKRITLQQKYKIQKRTKEHHRRLKKGVKTVANKKKQADTIPNAWPYKEDLLKQIKEAREKMEEVKQRQKEKRKEEFAARRAGFKKGAASDADAMDAESDSEEQSSKPKNSLNIPEQGITFDMASNHFDVDGSYDDTHGGKDLNLGQNSRRAYLKELRKTVEGADVILQVLDARDPLGTSSTAVEEMVTSKANKKFVYVLNKADLVPRDVLAGWLAYLRRSHPAIPFKCNTQQGQSKNLGRSAGKANKQGDGILQSTQAVGTEELLGLLKNYSRIGENKSVIVVGIVGFPNVGKSSLINSLMRSRAVGVSSVPGFTKVAQEVVLDKNIRLMDSPGIVFADGDSASTTLRNCVNVDQLEDVLTPIQAILERCPAGYLMQLYNIPAFKSTDVTGFLALVARATGKLKKGGIPNTDSAARTVLHDWNDGKIKYYCKAPQLARNAASEEEGESQIMSSFSKETSILDDRILDELEANEFKAGHSTSYVPMNAVASSLNACLDDVDETASVVSSSSKKASKAKASKASSSISASSSGNAEENAEDEAPGQDIRKLSKQAAKKAKKEARRGKEEYSFDEHF